jgi:hypothetical protein
VIGDALLRRTEGAEGELRRGEESRWAFQTEALGPGGSHVSRSNASTWEPKAWFELSA